MPRIDITYDTALRAGFREAMASTQLKSWQDQVAFPFRSMQPAGDTWALLGALPEFRPWQGEITAQSLDTWSKTITNSPFHDSVFIERNMWDFDKLGLVQAQISELANQANNFKLKLLTDRINNGHTEAGLDGTTFFSTTHTWGGQTANQSNLVSKNLNDFADVVKAGSGTMPSPEEAGRMMLFGAQTMMGFKNSQNSPQPFSSASFLVMVPLTYMIPYAAALGQDTQGNGTTNIIKTINQAGLNLTFNLVVNTVLDATSFATSIAMFRTDSPLKPLALQELRPVYEDILGPGSEHAKKHPNYIFSAKWEGNSANFFWHNALKLTHTRS